MTTHKNNESDDSRQSEAPRPPFPCPRCGYFVYREPAVCTHCNWAGRSPDAALNAEVERLRRFAEWVAGYEAEGQLVGSGVIEHARKVLGDG